MRLLRATEELEKRKRATHSDFESIRDSQLTPALGPENENSEKATQFFFPDVWASLRGTSYDSLDETLLFVAGKCLSVFSFFFPLLSCARGGSRRERAKSRVCVDHESILQSACPRALVRRKTEGKKLFVLSPDCLEGRWTFSESVPNAICASRRIPIRRSAASDGEKCSNP